MTTTFQYTVRDRAGKLVKGTISAENQTMVMQRLKAGGYAPVSITQANSGMKKEITIPGFGKKVKLKDLSVMARQFATMVNSGLSLLRTLSILSEQTTNKELARVLGVVRNEVETGTALSAALAKHPQGLSADHDQHGQGRRSGRVPRLRHDAASYELRV